VGTLGEGLYADDVVADARGASARLAESEEAEAEEFEFSVRGEEGTGGDGVRIAPPRNPSENASSVNWTSDVNGTASASFPAAKKARPKAKSGKKKGGRITTLARSEPAASVASVPAMDVTEADDSVGPTPPNWA
jgi:hypothetical protein